MKKYKSKIKLALIAVIVILFTLLISNFIVSYITETQRTTASKLGTNSEVGPKELVEQNSIEGTCGEFEVTQFNERAIGMSTGRILYCIQHGYGTHKAGEDLHMSTALKYGDRDGHIKSWSRTHRYCRTFEHNGEITYPYFECVGKHRDLLAEGNEDVAYIITYPPADQWTIEKQYAIWRTGINTGNALSSGSGTRNDETKDPVAYAKSEDIYNEAQKYKTFHEKTHKNGGESDLGIKNETDENNIRTSVNQAQQNYVMGPVSIDYNYGTEDGVTFGGISDMYAIGYNNKGEIVSGKERIEIGKYYTADGKGYELNKETYFQPNMEDKSYVDYGEQVYPKGITGGEDEFYFEFSNPNTNIDYSLENYEDYVVSYVKIHIDFQWMECATCAVCELDCAKYQVSWNDRHSRHMHIVGEVPVPCYYCKATSWLDRLEVQTHISVLEGSRKLYKSSLEIGGPSDFTLRMQLAGYVWADLGSTGKDNKEYNGTRVDGREVALPNINVILYNQSGIKVAEKMTSNDKNDKGYYIFTVDPMGKYYVAFEYNGQLYVPTTYDKPQYNSAEWLKTSKATEKDSERNALNEKFATIGDYPNNYVGGEIYSMQQLVTDGVIDSFFKIENGIIVQTDELYEATKKPSSKQQSFMDDCKILAYTKARNVEDIKGYDLYPVQDKFVINTKEYFNTGKEARDATFDTTAKVLGGENYIALYPGQFYIDLGLVRRKINDMALRKDVFRAATKINGKTEIYKYSGRPNDDEEFWDISVRLSDSNYYGNGYNREIFESDYRYKPTQEHPGAALEIFVTYKIAVRNQSQGILNTIDEVVDYYDTEYKYRKDLSWVTYDDNSFNDDQYYKAIHKEDVKQISNAKDVNSSETAGKIIVKGLSGKKLGVGEMEYIYLTFQVNKDSNGIILDNSESEAKYNVAEINVYTSYYQDNTSLPNGVVKGSKNYAGLLDIDSVPGNVDDKGNVQDEKNYEDDTDRAKGLRIKFYDNATRKINGTVWEDLRTETVDNAIIGNGIKDKGEKGIENIKVELVEKLTNGGEYIWKTTTLGATNQEKTNTDGTYLFQDYIPGDYVVRFTYGGEYNSTYNGQDYKSTIYQKEIDQNGRTNFENASDETIKAITELGQKMYYGYTDVENQNSSGSYGYSIIKSNGKNVSDAKDIWSERENIINYSNVGVTNLKAEELTQGKTKMVAETGVISIEVEYNKIITDKQDAYSITDVDLGLTERPKAQLELDKHVNNVRLTLANGNVLYDANGAVTNLAWIQGKDYNLRNSDGNYYRNYNSKFKYDATQEQVNNYVSSLYEGAGDSKKNGMIQAILDSELMHGATIRIDYTLTVKNVGETDYTGKEFYYKGAVGSGKIVTTSADTVVDYVSNNLQYREVDNSNWEVVSLDKLEVNEGIKANTSNKTILQTTKLSKALKPGETNAGNLVLSQTITSQNTSDDMTYDNIAEIIKYSNTVGRRMAYSVVGNQNPNEAPAEVDSAAAEKVIILPPFGETYLYFGLGIAVLLIIAGSIIIIKKKVLKK